MTPWDGDLVHHETAGSDSGVVTVRYWASARAVAGVESDTISVTGPISLAEVVSVLTVLHPDPRLEAVLGVCSVLIGDRPAGRTGRAAVMVDPGQTVEFLPPFAGG